MARMIGGKWKKLNDEEKKEFVEVAAVEKERYAKDLLAGGKSKRKILSSILWVQVHARASLVKVQVQKMMMI